MGRGGGGRWGLATLLVAGYAVVCVVLIAVVTTAVGPSARRPAAASAAFAGLAGAVVVAFAARRLAAPMADLTDVARAAAGGNREVSAPRSAVQEIDELGLAVAFMASGFADRALQAEVSVEGLEAVLGALPQGTVLVGADEGVAYANRAAEEMLGPIPGRLAALAPLGCQAVVREAKERGAQAERVLETATPVRRLRATATPFDDDDRVLLVVVDVTDQERGDEIRRDFVANASHELKTPVAAIVAAAEALRVAVDRGDESAVRFARQVEASARWLDDLVVDLLDLSRLERGSPDLSPVRLDLVARDEVERLRERAEAEGRVLRVEAQEVVVAGSRRDLAIAVRNLLDNAVRSTGEGGTIEVEVRAEGEEAVLSVADTGEGIPTRDLDRVFERFYRVDGGRSRATGGTGLGLAIVRHVAVGHDGAVSVESELGSGSTFTLRLPRRATG